MTNSDETGLWFRFQRDNGFGPNKTCPITGQLILVPGPIGEELKGLGKRFRELYPLQDHKANNT